MKTLIIAFKALSAYKLRTFFAIIGVLFGSLIFTVLLNTSEAMIAKTRKEIDKLGPNLMTAVAGTVRFNQGASITDSSGVTSFVLADYEDIQEKVAGISSLAPFIESVGQIRFKTTTTRAPIIATTEDYKKVRTLAIAYGTFLTEEDEIEKERVVVLGYSIAKTLFSNPEKAIGQRVRIERTILTVIGVAKELGQSPTGARPDEYIYIPLSTYMRRIANVNYITGVYISLFPSTNRVKIKKEIGSILRSNHNISGTKQDDFILFTSDETVDLQNKTLKLVRSLGILVAGISFSIGGLGILSIMILLVQIRRVEIGIRRAIGATRKDIIFQFLYESMLMSGVGGVIGMGFGCLLLFPIYIFGAFPFVYSPTILITASMSSLFIGIIAGVYPAWQASKIEILEALKT